MTKFSEIKFKMIAFVSGFILLFSSLMIILSKYDKVQNMDSVYFSMISAILGIWTPQPNNKKNTDVSTETIENIPPILIKNNKKRKRSLKDSSSSSFDSYY